MILTAAYTQVRVPTRGSMFRGSPAEQFSDFAEHLKFRVQKIEQLAGKIPSRIPLYPRDQELPHDLQEVLIDLDLLVEAASLYAEVGIPFS